MSSSPSPYEWKNHLSIQYSNSTELASEPGLLQDREEKQESRGRQPPGGARGVLATSHLPAAEGGNQRLCNRSGKFASLKKAKHILTNFEEFFKTSVTLFA
jgi:hypothetical protein